MPPALPLPPPHLQGWVQGADIARIRRRATGLLVVAGVVFVIEPQVRFKGLPGEQATMFFLDPSGNALEFKSFADPSQLFARPAAGAAA